MRPTMSLRSRRARLQRLLAREGEQAMRELRAALARLVDAPDQFRQPGRAGDLVAQQFRGGDDRRQDVVEVVGDAAGQLSDRLHLLRLAQLAFQPDPLGHVAADEEVLADPAPTTRRSTPAERRGRPCGRSGTRNCAWSGRAARAASRCGCSRDRRHRGNRPRCGRSSHPADSPGSMRRARADAQQIADADPPPG